MSSPEMRLHVAEGRDVITWQPTGLPCGVITGLRHTVDGRLGFEVDHIIRFPDTAAGTGTAMCVELLATLVEQWGLAWVAVKIHDDYHAEPLAAMAQRFGFAPVARQEPSVTVWRWMRP